MKTAFFGMGAMGRPMAANLLRAGHQVGTAVHRNAAFVEQFHQFEGFTLCRTPAQAARDADVILTVLPDGAQVKSLLLDGDFVRSVKPGTVLLEMSSCTTQAVQEVEAYYRPRGVSVVDAPVSGGTVGAQNGSLTIFASGEAEAIERVQPLMEAMGSRIFRLGRCGEGKTYKNLNNLLLTVNNAAVGEVFRLAEHLGLDLDLFYEVICASSGASSAFRTRWPRMRDGTLDGGFKLSLGRKDLGNALALAEGLSMPLSRLVYELMLANDRYDEKDIAAMGLLFRDGLEGKGNYGR